MQHSLEGHKAPRGPLCLTLREGDSVIFRGRRRMLKRPPSRLYRKQSRGAAEVRDVIWKVVGFQFVYRQPVLVRLKALHGKLQAVARLSELVALDEPRAICTTTKYDTIKQRVACWEVEHPNLGRVFAVRTPPFRAYIDQFKRLIKPENRRWDYRSRLWYVNQKQRMLLEALLRRHFEKGATCVPFTSTALD